MEIIYTEFGSIWIISWPDKRDLFLKLLIWNNSKFPYEKLTFFLGKLYQKFFLFYNLVTHGILDTKFGSLWTTPWPDQKDLFLKFVICENRKFPYAKLTFFLGKLYQKFFLFYSLVTHGILYSEFGSIWITSWPDKRDLFLKFLIWNNSKFPYEKLTFFLGKLYQKFFLFYNLVTHGILDTKFGSLWTTPWPDQKDLFLKFVICENRKFPYAKLTFFLGKLYQKFFLFYSLVTHGILYSEFGSIWITSWPDKRDLFLKFLIWNNSKFPYEKLTFFLGKLYQKFFLIYSLVTHGILYSEFGSIWITSWPDKRDLFLKFLIWNNSKFPYEKLTFFLGKLYQKFFLFYSLVTHGILYSEFGSIWITSWPDKRDLFLKFLIWNNSKFPYEKLTFFLGKLYQKFFLIYSLVTHGILYSEFGSIWITSWPDKRDLFLKFLIWNNSKFPYEKLTFFLGKLYQKFFLFYNLVTHGILDTKFGSLWTTPWPDQKDLFLKFVICENRKFPYAKLTFFLGKLYQKFFLFYSLVTHGILYSEFGSIWITSWPDKRDLFLKFLIWNNSKFPYEKLTFFLGKLYQKFFLFYNLVTHGILDTKFGSLWTTPWPDQKDLFLKFVICENRKFPYAKLTFFLGKLYQKFFLFYSLVTHGILYSEFGSIWITSWPDKRDLFLKFLIWNNSKFPYEKLTFFLGKLYQKFFLIYSLVTHGILYSAFGSIWITSWPDKRDLFLKLLNWNNSNFPYEKLTFFLGKLYQKLFLFYNPVTHVILDTKFGSIWITSWPDKRDLFLKLLIWNNSKFPYEKLTFFLGKLYQKFFLFYNLVTHGILDTKFGSLWTTPWPDQKDLFLKFVICEIRKFPYANLTFFLGKLYQKFFLFYSLVTHGILYSEFGSIWITSWPDKRDLFLKLLNWNNSKFPYENLTLFLGKLHQKLFLFYNPVTHGILDTKFGSIWITSWPDKRDLFLNLLIWNNFTFPYEKLTFFLGKLYQKFVLI